MSDHPAAAISRPGARLSRLDARPLLDAFGTRLEEGEIVAGLSGQGLAAFSLLVADDELVLRLPKTGASAHASANAQARLSADAQARAATWLKTVFSPLLPCRVEASLASAGGPIREVVLSRVLPLRVVSIVEAPLRGPLAAAGRNGLTLAQWRRGKRWAGASLELEPFSLAWDRPGKAQGVRPARFLASSREAAALDWLAAGLAGRVPADAPFLVLVDGLEWAVARRPTVAVEEKPLGGMPVVADRKRCRRCGLCGRVCPASCIGPGGAPAGKGAQACLRCFDCVEACPQDALRPVYGPSSATLSSVLARRPEWLSRLAGAEGPESPEPFPPSFLLPRDGAARKPRVVLGLAITTMQENAAALFKDGMLVGAVEEERFSRVRHHGWHAPGRPGVTVAVDPTLCIEEAFCRRAIDALLGDEGLELDGVDLIAVNGLPARYRRAYSMLDSNRPIPALRAGRVLYVPHHLCHAASAYRLSGMRDSWILTVDGRGDRETAAVFRAKGGAIAPVLEVLSLTDRSVGGVYETVSRLLGLGPHGQGSVMALASFGNPVVDLEPFLSWRGREDFDIHESGLAERFAGLAADSDAGRPGAPPPPDADGLPSKGRRDLAASAQEALESVVIGILRSAGVKPGAAGLCLAGGVALNCRMNRRLREVFRPRRMFVQPGANDAGTALGAALEALSMEGVAAGLSGARGTSVERGSRPAAERAGAAMDHALLGPSFSNEEIGALLRRSGMFFFRSADAPSEAARRVAGGEVVCWFDGRLEFGPRALGSRSILADPRRTDVKDRVNRLKGREPWRPFGPAVLAELEREWFEDAFDSRFMLFTMALRRAKAPLVPAVLHADGTSRPQTVHRGVQPRFHELILRFLEMTGVPMVLNTSFNRRGEPIVCSPDEALACFCAMGADSLVMGDWVATGS